MRLRLVTVLEFSPRAGDASNEPAPSHPWWISPETWEDFRTRGLAGAGFPPLHSVVLGTGLYTPEMLEDSALATLVAEHLFIVDREVPIEASCALFGGYILYIDDKPWMLPQCCATVADIVWWRQLLAEPPPKSVFLREGHPVPELVVTGEVVTIICEDDFEPFLPACVPPRVVVPLDELRRAIMECAKQVDALHRRLTKLQRPEGGERLAWQLVYETS